MTVDQHAEDLASDLGVDKAEVKRDLENLLEYSVPVEEAIESLRRKYDDGNKDASTPDPVEIATITTDAANVTVTARVLTVGQRSIRYEGDEQVIHEGELADESGRIPYTAWDEFGLEPGDTVTIRNANVREWEGTPELNLGETTSITPKDTSLTVPYEIGGDEALIDLEPGDRGINIDVKVTEVETKTIDGRDGETDILSGVLADESARLPFTDWRPHPELEPGAELRIEGVYVREFRGVPSVNISEFSTIQPLDRAIEPAEATPMTVRDAVETGGAFDIVVTAHIVGIRDGSGLIQRCPECGRVIQKGQCRSHGDVDGIDDLRVKAILDDGTGTVTAILDNELTADIYGGDVAAAREEAEDAMDQSVVTDAISEQILGREYRVRGNVSVDEYGANLEAAAFEPVAIDPESRASEFLEGVR